MIVFVVSYLLSVIRLMTKTHLTLMSLSIAFAVKNAIKLYTINVLIFQNTDELQNVHHLPVLFKIKKKKKKRKKSSFWKLIITMTVCSTLHGNLSANVTDRSIL